MSLIISQQSRKLLRIRFGLQKIDERSFVRRGIDQATVVLCLLSENYLHDVEKIIGKPITYLPPDPNLSPIPHKILPHKKPEPRIHILRPNPPVVRERAERWSVVREGFTLNKLYRLGVKPRDIKSWTRRKYIKVIRP